MTEARLLDVNVLLALTQSGHAMNDAAHRWFSSSVRGGGWATCPMTEAAFVRISCNPAFAGRSITVDEALASLAVLRSAGGHRFIADMTSLSRTDLDLRALVGTKQVTDFHLVNLAASSRAVLATFDRRLLDSLAPEDQRFVELIPV